MDKELLVRRRVLHLTYRRYLEADLAWARARREARSWFPPAARPPRGAIGDPESRMRRLHDRRADALQRMQVAMLKLQVARRRLDRDKTVHTVRLGAYIPAT